MSSTALSFQINGLKLVNTSLSEFKRDLKINDDRCKSIKLLFVWYAL